MHNKLFMKTYLLDTFRYNRKANSILAAAINGLPDKEAAVKLFSHIIAAQDKWHNRLTRLEKDSAFQWNGTVLNAGELEQEWLKSVDRWIGSIERLTEEELESDIVFIRPSDGKQMAVKIKDVALQLNYHAIHHRAQINTLISKQDISPPVTDYIFTALREM